MHGWVREGRPLRAPVRVSASAAPRCSSRGVVGRSDQSGGGGCKYRCLPPGAPLPTACMCDCLQTRARARTHAPTNLTPLAATFLCTQARVATLAAPGSVNKRAVTIKTLVDALDASHQRAGVNPVNLLQRINSPARRGRTRHRVISHTSAETFTFVKSISWGALKAYNAQPNHKSNSKGAACFLFLLILFIYKHLCK